MHDNSRNRTDINPEEALKNPNAPGHNMCMAQQERDKQRRKRKALANGFVKFLLWSVIFILGCVILGYIAIQNNPELVTQKLFDGAGLGGPSPGG